MKHIPVGYSLDSFCAAAEIYQKIIVWYPSLFKLYANAGCRMRTCPTSLNALDTQDHEVMGEKMDFFKVLLTGVLNRVL